MDLSGFSLEIQEKIERLSHILLAIGETEFLRQRLSLYGGTALNLVHLSDAPRLSEDLDFNFRSTGDGAWDQARDMVDEKLKAILYRLGYDHQSVKIQPQYNLGRFFVKYETRTKLKDLIKIEIGYMRRIPDLESEPYFTFQHPNLPRSTSIKSPAREELFANKFCTMFSRMRKRANIRDIYDVLTISTQEFDEYLFLDLVMIECLLMDIRREELVFRPSQESKQNPLFKLVFGTIELNTLFTNVEAYSQAVVCRIEECGYNELRSGLFEKGQMRLDLFHYPERVHPDIGNHPQLLWLRHKHEIK